MVPNRTSHDEARRQTRLRGERFDELAREGLRVMRHGSTYYPAVDLAKAHGHAAFRYDYWCPPSAQRN